MARGGGDNPKNRALTVFLLKEDTASYEDGLESPASLTVHKLKRSSAVSGAIYLARQRKVKPDWLEFLEDGSASKLTALFNASTSAVLFVNASSRIFAFTFGYGRSLLKPDRIERAFGLRVVLNTVNEQALSSIDSKTVQEITVQTRRQVSRSSRLSEFGIDTEEDMLGSVRGMPRDSNFARTVAGADALQLSTPIEFKDLGKKCRKIFEAYNCQDYKKRGFEFVDHVRVVKDPVRIAALDDFIARAVQEGRMDGLHMAPPEIVNWNEIVGFSFAPKAEPEGDLEIASFLQQIRGRDKISAKRLKLQKVYVHSANAAQPAAIWTVYRTLVADVQMDGSHYVLSGGEWFEIEHSFAARINKRAKKIEEADFDLPLARPRESEQEYNLRAGAARGVYCLDRQCSRVAGDKIELCDLYISERNFVHVKKWTASSTLSHLYMQGKASAEALLADEEFRREARTLLSGKSASLVQQIPVGRPDPTKYTVVFAIIKAGRMGWQRDLPFFSQLHLVRTAESLRTLGFNVRVARIGVEL